MNVANLTHSSAKVYRIISLLSNFFFLLTRQINQKQKQKKHVKTGGWKHLGRCLDAAVSLLSIIGFTQTG